MFRLQDLTNYKTIRWPIYVLFGLIIISFVFFYGWSSSQSRQARGSMTFAKLRSESLNPFRRWIEIDRNWIAAMERAALNEKLRLLPPMWQRLAMQMGPRIDLVENKDLILEAANSILLDRASRDLNLAVSQQQIIDQLRQAGLSDAFLVREQRRRGLASKWDVIELLQRQTRRSRVETLKGMVAHASLFELWQEYKLGNEQIVLEVGAYPVDAYTDEVEASESDLQSYLEANLEQFHIPEQRRYAYAKLNKSDIRKGIQPSEAELAAYYEQHADAFRIDAGVRVEELYTPLGDDASSTGAVRTLQEVRQDAASTSSWNNLAVRLEQQHPESKFYARQPGWLLEGQSTRPPSYMDRVRTLEIDEVSTPVVTAEGVYLIRVLERRASRVPPFQEVRGEVREAYLEETAEEKFQQRAEILHEELKSYGTLHDFARDVGLEDELTTRVAATRYNIPGIGSLQRHREYISTLREGDISLPVPMGDTYVFLQVVEVVEAHAPTLDEVREEVARAYRATRARQRARELAEAALAQVRSGSPYRETLEAAPQPTVRTDPFTRTQSIQTLGSPLIDFTQQTLAVDVGSIGMNPYGVNPEQPEGFAVWKVVQMDPPDLEQFKQERQRFEQEYLQIQRMAIVKEWLADQRRRAEFQLSEQLKERTASAD